MTDPMTEGGSGDVDSGDYEGLAPQEATDADERFGDDPRPGYRPDENEYEPPDDWSGATLHGTTPAEESEGASLDQRLREEQPDVEPLDPPERSVAETPIDELDDSVDEPLDVEEPAADPELAAGLGGELGDDVGGGLDDDRQDPGDEAAGPEFAGGEYRPGDAASAG